MSKRGHDATEVGIPRVSSYERTDDETQGRIFSSMSSGFVATVIVSALGAISVRAITTRLGAGAFGIFVLVGSYASLVQTFNEILLEVIKMNDRCSVTPWDFG